MRWDEYRNIILATVDNEAFFLAELDDVNRRGHELKAKCPFAHLHESSVDNTPSLTVNIDSGIYYCQTCHSKGNVHTMLMWLYKFSATEAWFKLGDALNIERPDSDKPVRPDIEPGLDTMYHKDLMKSTAYVRDMLRDRRGYSDETLSRFKLGWNGERITIPVYDEYNRLVNLRLYQWDSTDDQWKVLNYSDERENSYGEVRIYGIENLTNTSIKSIIWCEGETDRILSEQMGFPTACPTSGAGSWLPNWNKYFRHIDCIYLAQDNDEAGRVATAKIAEKLYRITKVYIINWPDDMPDKGDITDFYIKLGKTKEDFQKLLDEATLYVGSETEVTADTSDVEEVGLHTSANSEYYGKRIKVPVMVSGKNSTPYMCPENVNFSCGDSADPDSKKCAVCMLATYGGEHDLVLKSSNKHVLKLINCTDRQQAATLREMVGINEKCTRCKITIEQHMNMEEIRMIPRAENGFGFSLSNDYVVRTGFMLADNLKTNKRYTMAGYMFSDPSTQFATYLFDKAYPEKDFISNFEMSDEIHEQLKIFQPAEGQSVSDKFEAIHTDFERNVTYVWERMDVAIATDLVYHTALSFYFQEQFVKRGWGELLIIGDSGQAKTTTVERIMRHYRLGEIHSGESSKRTGLVYSMQQTNKSWFLVWGALPLNDGGLVTLDELSGLKEEDLAVMSDVRSSGIAKATGVVTAETNSRTRVIYISNPRSGRPLNTETFGVTAVLKLFGKAEDVRRLDMAMAVASGDVDPALVNRRLDDMEKTPHVYTSDLCNIRVLWAWSRKPSDIKFAPGAVDLILKHATDMGRKYTASIPIVEAADQRLKIARLAIAAAACMYSTDDGTSIIVEAGHIDFVVKFMNKIYCTKSFGYDRLSSKDSVNSDASSDRLLDLRKKFIMVPVHDHNEIAEALHGLTYFSRNTLEDHTGLDRDTLGMLMKFLTTQHLIEKIRNEYRRYPLGTTFIEYIISEPISSKERIRVQKEVLGNVDNM